MQKNDIFESTEAYENNGDAENPEPSEVQETKQAVEETT